VRFFVGLSFLSGFEAGLSTLSLVGSRFRGSKLQRESILERSANFSSEKQPADLFGRSLSRE
ncbi:MAG: hypothetical protein AAF471_04430, partial [Myxococcota bacterium]